MTSNPVEVPMITLDRIFNDREENLRECAELVKFDLFNPYAREGTDQENVYVLVSHIALATVMASLPEKNDPEFIEKMKKMISEKDSSFSVLLGYLIAADTYEELKPNGIVSVPDVIREMAVDCLNRVDDLNAEEQAVRSYLIAQINQRLEYGREEYLTREDFDKLKK